MVQTNATPKVSYVKPSPADEHAQNKAQEAKGDVYSSGSADNYKNLIKGEFKAEAIDGGVISEMYDAASGKRTVKRDYYSQMQNLIGGLMVGEARERPAYDCVGNIPYVPDLEKDILRHTCLHENMKPVVERYAALEKVLITMYDNLRVALHPTKMSQMTASEIRSLQAYAKKLKKTLAYCRSQLSLAHDFLKKQIEQEMAEKAEEA